MLVRVLPTLRQYRVILASQSPRRIELLEGLGLTLDVIPSRFDETLDKTEFPTPDLYVIATAKGKALEVFNRIKPVAPFLLIASDTVVVLDGKILEKPRDETHAFEMLSSLSGRQHDVYSGVVVFHSDTMAEMSFYEKTIVKMGNLTPEMIRAYIATGDPMDKAGGYGIQTTECSSFIAGIDGCYNNVVGFPLHRFCKELTSSLSSSLEV